MIESVPEGASPEPLGTDTGRREHERTVLAANVSMESDHNFFMGFTENISEGGLFIATHQIHAVGSVVGLSFGIPGREGPIRATGEVRWVRLFNESSDAPPGMGIRFVDIAPEDLEAVRAFVGQRSPLFWD